MKQSQKGSAAVVLLIIIVLILLGCIGWMYINYVEVRAVPSNVSPQNSQSTQTNVGVNSGMSEKDQIIQAILNSKKILTSGDATQIRSYLKAEFQDTPLFEKQLAAMNDTALVSYAGTMAKAMDGIDENFLRSHCQFTITSTTAKCTWTPTPSTPNYTRSITVVKVNGVWQ